MDFSCPSPASLLLENVDLWATLIGCVHLKLSLQQLLLWFGCIACQEIESGVLTGTNISYGPQTSKFTAVSPFPTPTNIHILLPVGEKAMGTPHGIHSLRDTGISSPQKSSPSD